MKRTWFQLHLSTLLILSFVAGVLLWANLRGFRSDGYDFENYGFPFPMREFQLIVIDCVFDPKEETLDSTYFLPWNIARTLVWESGFWPSWRWGVKCGCGDGRKKCSRVTPSAPSPLLDRD